MRFFEGVFVGLAIVIPMWAAIILGGCKATDVIKRYTSTSTTTTTIPAQQLPNNLLWKGASYGNAQFDSSVRFSGASLDENKAYYDITLPESWRITTVNVKVQAIVCFGYERDGEIVIGKYDWMRVGGQAVKSLENVHHGYNGLEMPIRGTRCFAMVVSVDGRYRSDLVEMNWN